jgi:hypothetical protein
MNTEVGVVAHTFLDPPLYFTLFVVSISDHVLCI